jgi:hypothetical protein
VHCRLIASDGAMPGASDATQPVKVLNANWVRSSVEGEDGEFQILIVTDTTNGTF